MKHHLRRTILIASVVFYGLSAWAYAYNAPSVPHAPTAYSDALDHTTRHSYNAAGQIAQQTAFDGATTTWQYGASGANAGRLLKLLRPDGSSQELAYDSYGRVNRHTDTRDGTETLTLDSLGRTTRQDLSHPAAQLAGSSNYSVTTQYQWDAVGNRSQLRIASPNRDINASWDAAGQLQTLTSIEGGDNHFSFDAAGRLAQIERSDGSTSSYQYNAAGQLTGIHHQDQNDATLARFDYTLNQNGQRTQAVETIHAAGQSTERTVTYQYDGAGKLKEEHITQTQPSAQQLTIAYTHDQVGNRTARTITGDLNQTTTYTYDANDRLTQEVDSIHGTTTYQYDANGNLTQKTNGANTTTYNWNSDNRLIEVQTGSTTIRYGYDPQGRRIKRLKTEGSDKEETHYILDTQRAYHDIVIKRTRRNSGPWQETSYLFTPDGIGAPLSQHNGTDTTQIYADGQGSTRLTLDGASAHTASYDAFGIRLHGSASTTHGYTGEQQDEDTGLIYLRARDYDPSTGRFISMDEHPGSQRIPLTLNKYLYGNADPVNFVDPSGHVGLGGMMSGLSGMANLATMSMVRYQIFDMLSNALLSPIMDAALDAFMKDGSNPSRLIQGNAGVAQLLTSLAVQCRVTKKCLFRKVPVMVNGWAHPKTTRHIWDALMGNGGTNGDVPYPLSFVLIKGSDRSDVKPSVRNSSVLCGNRPMGYDCDEYPYASTLNGGTVMYNLGGVSLRGVPKSDNRSQGGKLGVFYKRNRISKGKPFINLAIPYPALFMSTKKYRPASLDLCVGTHSPASA